MRIYRISNYHDLNGEGGRRTGGRWHSKGRPIVYCAGTAAAAMLEAIAYVARGDPALIPSSFQLLTIELPDDVTREVVVRTQLTADWQSKPAQTRAIGDAWLALGGCAVLVVPSALAPDTENYLLNPAHADLQPPGGGRIRIVEAAHYPFDSRLFEGLSSATTIGLWNSSGVREPIATWGCRALDAHGAKQDWRWKASHACASPAWAKACLCGVPAWRRFEA